MCKIDAFHPAARRRTNGLLHRSVPLVSASVHPGLSAAPCWEAVALEQTAQSLSSGLSERRPQLKPSPARLGLCVHRIGSVTPLPSGPRPIPGHQPMFCSMRFPTFESGIAGTPSPTTPEDKGAPIGAALRLLLTSPVHNEPRWPLVCLLAVFSEQLLRWPRSDLESQ